MSEDRIKRAERRRLKSLKDKRLKDICDYKYIDSVYYTDGYIKRGGRVKVRKWLKESNNRRLRRSTYDLYQRSLYKKKNEFWWILI